jgi:hypothetical protein
VKDSEARALWKMKTVRMPSLLLLLLALTNVRSSVLRDQVESEEREQLIMTLQAHMQRASRSPEAEATFKAFEQRQDAARRDLAGARFVMARMNPAAGLGNRMVALVSAFVLAVVTDRALIIEWEAYAEPRTHRSKEVATSFHNLPLHVTSVRYHFSRLVATACFDGLTGSVLRRFPPCPPLNTLSSSLSPVTQVPFSPARAK